jgi:hypothetical protein
MGSQPANHTARPAAVAVSHLVDDLVAPLEAVVNLLYLIRISGSDAEARERFAILAETKMQEIVQIMKRHDPAA